MDRQRRRWAIILLMAAVIVAGSLYSSCRDKPAVDNGPDAKLSGGVNTEVMIHISGEVNNPGVYKLPAGSRVADAVGAAGGLADSADETKVNLARILKDGMHINVPPVSRRSGPSQSQAGQRRAAETDCTEKVSINTAGKFELEKLPGIGPNLAERIIEYRLNNGLFQDIVELKKVPGIGETKFNKIKNKIKL